MRDRASLDQSLGEWEALVLKAARGVGYPWGIAEEFAFAAGWLAERGWSDWHGLLALLRNVDGGAQSTWVSPPDCAVTAGCAWLDAGNMLTPDNPAPPTPFRAPVLAAPFLDRLASRQVCHIRLRWHAARVELFGFGQVRWFGAGLHCESGDMCWTVEPASASAGAAGVSHTRARVAPEVHAELHRLAYKTYVPASALSRSGAGPQVDDD